MDGAVEGIKLAQAFCNAMMIGTTHMDVEITDKSAIYKLSNAHKGTMTDYISFGTGFISGNTEQLVFLAFLVAKPGPAHNDVSCSLVQSTIAAKYNSVSGRYLPRQIAL